MDPELLRRSVYQRLFEFVKDVPQADVEVDTDIKKEFEAQR